MGKRTILIVLILFLLVPTLVFSGGGNASADDGKWTIGFIQLTMNAPYYVAMWDRMAELAVTENFELLAVASNRDVSIRARQVEDMLARGVDGMILNIVDPIAEMGIDEQIVEAGIPLVYIDSGPDSTVGEVTIIQSDNYNIGRFAAIPLVERFNEDFPGEKMNVLLLTGGPEDVVVGPARYGGFLDELENQGANFEVVTRAVGDYSVDGGVRGTEDALVAHPEINVIFGNNDAMALGALQVVQDAGRDDILLVGIDGQREAFEAIKNGGPDGQYVSTGLNSPMLAAERCVEIILSILNGETKPDDYPEREFTPAVGISYDNVDEWYDPMSIF